MCALTHNPSPLKKVVYFFKASHRGGALYIAIIISIIIGIMLLLFILSGSYNQRTITRYAQNQQLNYNLKTAFELVQSAYFTEARNNVWIKNTFNDDSIRVKKEYWGAYLLIKAYTKNRHAQASQCGLYGTYINQETGLMIAENSRPTGLSGEVVFRANCYLPKAGIKPAYIEGQSYQGNAQNTGFIKPSPAQLPQPDERFVEGIRQQKQINPANDSILTDKPQEWQQAFTNRTVIYEAGAAKLSHLKLSKNIKLVGTNLDIDSTCRLDNIVILCKSIHFGRGFKGKVHVIASDSIISREDCTFQFPSSFVLLPESNNESISPSILFGSDNTFYGGIVALQPGTADAQNARVFIKLNASGSVNGLVYSGSYLHVEGTINANVFSNKLLLKTPSAVYENHLLGCTINPRKYALLLAVPVMFNQPGNLFCCEKI